MEITISGINEDFIVRQLQKGHFESPEEVVIEALSKFRKTKNNGAEERDRERITETIEQIELFARQHNLAPGITIKEMVESGRM